MGIVINRGNPGNCVWHTALQRVSVLCPALDLHCHRPNASCHHLSPVLLTLSVQCRPSFHSWSLQSLFFPEATILFFKTMNQVMYVRCQNPILTFYFYLGIDSRFLTLAHKASAWSGPRPLLQPSLILALPLFSARYLHWSSSGPHTDTHVHSGHPPPGHNVPSRGVPIPPRAPVTAVSSLQTLHFLRAPSPDRGRAQTGHIWHLRVLRPRHTVPQFPHL